MGKRNAAGRLGPGSARRPGRPLRRARRHFRGPIFSNAASQASSAARFILGKTIGVVLGGGGARGFAHIGVMRALEKNGIEADAYCGSSMGGIVAALYAMGRRSDAVLETVARHAKKKGNKFDFQFPLRSLIKGKKLEKMAEEVYGHSQIEELLHPLYLVCADLVTGEEVVLAEGPVRTAVYASADMPGIMPPVKMGNRRLVDGSLLNKVPTSVLKERGIQHAVAVNVTPKRDATFANPNILRIITRSFELINYKLSYSEIGPGDALIEPALGNFDFFGFKDIEKIVAEGEKQAEAAMEKILKF